VIVDNKFLLPQDWLQKPLNISLLGCSGTGSYIAQNLLMLERALVGISGEGLGKVTLYDAKDIAAPNLARTPFMPYEVGLNKAEVLAGRLNAALGYELFTPVATNITKIPVYGGSDLYITATDSIASRQMVAQYARGCERARSLWLDTGVNKATASCVLGEMTSNADRLPMTTDLFTRLPDKDEAAQPSCDMAQSLARQAFGVNANIAGIAVNLIAQLLMEGELSYHGVLLDQRSGFTSPIQVNKEVWKSFGFTGEATEPAV